MGNRIIDLGAASQTETEERLDKYRDVSMVAVKRAGNASDDGSFSFRAAADVNVKAVFNSIRNIFTWIKGERILNPEFGSKLRQYLYEGITQYNKEQIVAEVRGVCLQWEPRVEIVSVQASDNVEFTEDNTVSLDIIFRIPSLSDKQYQYSYIYDRTS